MSLWLGKKECAVPLRETKTVRHFRFASISLTFNKTKENGDANGLKKHSLASLTQQNKRRRTPKHFFSDVMAGRKRKTLALIETAAPVSTGSKHKCRTDRTVSPAKLKKSTFSSDDHSVETETSHYFAKHGSTQHKLGEDFFRQPCVSLAKALLGTVRMPPPRSFLRSALY